jgi:hypothetical protein
VGQKKEEMEGVPFYRLPMAGGTVAAGISPGRGGSASVHGEQEVRQQLVGRCREGARLQGPRGMRGRARGMVEQAEGRREVAALLVAAHGGAGRPARLGRCAHGAGGVVKFWVHGPWCLASRTGREALHPGGARRVGGGYEGIREEAMAVAVQEEEEEQRWMEARLANFYRASALVQRGTTSNEAAARCSTQTRWSLARGGPSSSQVELAWTEGARAWNEKKKKWACRSRTSRLRARTEEKESERRIMQAETFYRVHRPDVCDAHAEDYGMSRPVTNDIQKSMW